MKLLVLAMLFASAALGQSMPDNMSGMQMPSSSNPAAQQAIRRIRPTGRNRRPRAAELR